MNFARKILNKYGWKEGEGLGKHKDGIVKPLKASMKFDNAGLGSDQAASDFNNHWWERVFNEAASNVDIKSGKDGVSMALKNKDDAVEITAKGYSSKKLKKAKESRSTSDARYDNFLQSATLTKSGDEVKNPNKIVVADISVSQYKTLTDEELFKACGGRTAHKGARHGLKLSGKLSRIEQQEQKLLAKIQERMNTTSPKEDSLKVPKKNKRKKHKGGDTLANNEVSEATVTLIEEFYNQESHNKKRKHKEEVTYSNYDEVPKEAGSSVENELLVDQIKTDESLKKHRKEGNADQPHAVADDQCLARAVIIKQKKIKRKLEKNSPASTIVDIVNDSNSTDVPKIECKDECNVETKAASRRTGKKSKKSSRT
ncbi:G patch domain-containing protein 4 [Eurosta solidaginis]|uniref:G patch domain-containing protein 4 n=1 Tax=Eurosta solidaginis TaxID=178769 RepID=UPI00353141B4